MVFVSCTLYAVDVLGHENFVPLLRERNVKILSTDLQFYRT